MIFRLFITVLFFGFAILVGILAVMRGLYGSSIFQPPDVPDDAAAKGSFEDRRRIKVKASLPLATGRSLVVHRVLGTGDYYEICCYRRSRPRVETSG